jgi:hypothetical protein
MGGAFSQFGISDYFAMRIELLYSGKGANASWGSSEVTLMLDYVEIPVVAVATLPAGESFYDLFAGPAIAFRTRASLDGQNRSQDFESIDYGIALGIGGRFGAGNAVLILESRYTLGLAQVDDKQKNRAFGLMVGFAFPLNQ